MKRWIFRLALLLAPLAALAHEGHTVTNAQYGIQAPEYKQPGYFSQTGTYLYGINRDRTQSTFGDNINCCRYGGDGDCQIYPVENVKAVPGGYDVGGEFIPEAETTASPDDNYYRCQHAGKPSHCFFAPPQGF